MNALNVKNVIERLEKMKVKLEESTKKTLSSITPDWTHYNALIKASLIKKGSQGWVWVGSINDTTANEYISCIREIRKSKYITSKSKRRIKKSKLTVSETEPPILADSASVDNSVFVNDFIKEAKGKVKHAILMLGWATLIEEMKNV